LSRTPEFFNKGAFILKTLEEDEQAITSLYVKQGYMAPVVESRLRINEVMKKNKKRVNIVFDIKEGVQTRVTSVKFPGLNVLSKSEILDAVALKKGSVFRSHMIENDENELSSLISEKGCPLVLELQPGESFSLIRLLESQRNIRNINAFESVDFKTFGLKEEADAVNLLVEVEEK